MSSTVNVLTELKVDHYLITATVQAGGTLPIGIFIYENNGTNVIGDFYGTCSIEELGRLQLFTGVAIPTFGNRFVRYIEAKIIVDLKDDPSRVVTGLIKNVTTLSTTLQTKVTISSNYLIP